MMDLLERLGKAQTSEERGAIILMSFIDRQNEGIREAIFAASCLSWFDEDYLGYVLENTGNKIVQELYEFPFVEEFTGRGHNLHESVRHILTKHLSKVLPEKFHQFHQRGLEFADQRDDADTEWKIEYMIHSVIVQPDRAAKEINTLCKSWSNPPNYNDVNIDCLLNSLKEYDYVLLSNNNVIGYYEYWRAELDNSAYRHPESKNHLAKALKCFTAEANQLGIANTYYLLSEIAQKDENFAEALELIQKAYEIYSEMNHLICKGNAALLRAHIMLVQERWDEARRHCMEANEIFRQNENVIGLGSSNQTLGEIDVENNEVQRAAEYFEKALGYYTEIKSVPGMATAYLGIARVYYEEENYSQTKYYCEKALGQFEAVGELPGMASVRVLLGQAGQKERDVPTALENYSKAMEIWSQLGISEDRFGWIPKEVLYLLDKTGENPKPD